MVKDPVCGMEIDEKKGAAKSGYKEKFYYFCSSAYKKSFDKNPEKYVNMLDEEAMEEKDE